MVEDRRAAQRKQRCRTDARRWKVNPGHYVPKVFSPQSVFLNRETELNAQIKVELKYLEDKVIKKYSTLTEAEIKTLVVEDKWMAALEKDVRTEMERISRRLTGRIKELAERYATPMPALTSEVAALEKKVHAHLKRMGFVWK